ncbi:MAG: 50S ribosomal protein L29 [Deltaproteobacteria bacterium]|nr:50S ribosomal protein L29 [Deltaproteobacteria bacterium]
MSEKPQKRNDLLDDLRRLERNDLVERRSELEREALSLRLQSGGATVKNVRAIRNVRRKIARVNTVIREKAGQQPGGEG